MATTIAGCYGGGGYALGGGYGYGGGFGGGYAPAVYGSYTEGFTTPDLVDAKALIRSEAGHDMHLV